MRSLILHNEKAGFSSDAIYMFVRSITHPGDSCEFRSLSDGWNAEDAFKDAEEFDQVVISGGDGTTASLLYAAKDKDLNVCVFPSGTANLFFSNLGNSPEPAAVARACRIGRTFDCDLGGISWADPQGQEHHCGFTLMTGSGFDASLMRAAVPNKKAMGESAYFLAAFDNSHPPVVTFTIELDDQTVVREGIACIVANCAMIQGDIEIMPDCRLDDGLLDVIVLETNDAVGLLRPLLFGLIDHHGANLGRPRLERFRTKRVHVSSSKPIPLQIDGDALDYEISQFSARVLPERVSVIVDSFSPYYPQDHDDLEPRFPGSEIEAFPHS